MSKQEHKQKNSPEQIKVIEVNPPTKEEAEQKIKELSGFLSNVWNTTLKIR